MKSLAEARVKRARAVELAAEGKSYEEIARSVGYSHRGSAHRAVFKALNDREAADVEDLRRREMARLERLLGGVWDEAQNGDLRAVQLCTRIIDQQCKLMGLHAPSSRQDVADSDLLLVRG